MAVMEAEFRPARRRYPWPKWTNGRPWKAKYGVDFDVPPVSFKGAVYNWAERHGLIVTVSHPKGTDWVRFQFLPRKAKKRGAK